MLLYLSQDTLNQRLLETNEGIRPDELTVRKEQLLKPFVNYVESHGVKFAGVLEAKGNFAVARLNLLTTDKAKVGAALDFVAPLAVTIERADLNALIPSRIVRLAVESAWPTVSKDFERLATSQIFDTVEAVAMSTATRASASPTIADEERAEREALAAMKAAGIRDPLEALNQRDAENRRERDVQWQENERWLNGDYQEPPQPGETRCPHNLPLESCVICFS